VQDRSDQESVAGLLPVVSLVEATFGIDKDVGNVLDIANFPLAAPNLEQATTLLKQMRVDYPSAAYTQQAGLAVARAELITDPQRAADDLKYTMENSKDTELAMIARLRLARVQAYREQYSEAIATLTVDKPGKFAGRINEIKGDIFATQGKVEEARAAYLAAMVASGAEVLDRSYLQMKLADLPNAPAINPPAEQGAAPTPAEPANLKKPGEGA